MYEPPIDQEGVYTIKAPFDKLLEKNVIYKCQGIRSMAELVADGIDPFKKYYEPVGATHADFVTDVSNKVNIVIFLAGTGNWQWIPASYIEGAPNTSGEKYVPAMLGVYLGHVSELLPFEDITDKIKGVVRQAVGIDPQVKLVNMGPAMLLDDAAVERTRISREAIKGPATEGTFAKAARLEQENNSLRETVKQLNKYIADHSL